MPSSTIETLRPLPAEVSIEGNVDLWDVLQQYEQQYGGLDAAATAEEVEMTDAAEEKTVDQGARELHLQRYVDDYFARFHHQWPLLHRPAFQPDSEPRFLVLSMVMVSLWTSGEARAQDAAVQMHERFMVMLHEQRVQSFRFSSFPYIG
ncbi:hypothetical protein BK809_0006253 [Diplodia seriata]|uniref:Xylanolytic transcriptional activator regulatory domain-containing protein n=1 Tax=Diplodia seriata TaxID=420778 RepID=A0A1S8B3G6_9PEZI|nr:hypothetical protein BK809_0006253 [Diplodia seriata]